MCTRSSSKKKTKKKHGTSTLFLFCRVFLGFSRSFDFPQDVYLFPHFLLLSFTVLFRFNVTVFLRIIRHCFTWFPLFSHVLFLIPSPILLFPFLTPKFLIYTLFLPFQNPSPTVFSTTATHNRIDFVFCLSPFGPVENNRTELHFCRRSKDPWILFC